MFEEALIPYYRVVGVIIVLGCLIALVTAFVADGGAIQSNFTELIEAGFEKANAAFGN